MSLVRSITKSRGEVKEAGEERRRKEKGERRKEEGGRSRSRSRSRSRENRSGVRNAGTPYPFFPGAFRQRLQKEILSLFFGFDFSYFRKTSIVIPSANFSRSSCQPNHCLHLQLLRIVLGENQRLPLESLTVIVLDKLWLWS